MKAHAESIWLNTFNVAYANRCGVDFEATVTRDESQVDEHDVEFVPAAAYIELKAKLELALGVIERHGGTDESHHQTWVIDQVVRALTGEGYAKWVDDMKGATGDSGTREYDWNEGIAP